MFDHPSLCSRRTINEIALPGCGEFWHSGFVGLEIDEGVGSASEPHSLMSGESPLPHLDVFSYLLYLGCERVIHNSIFFPFIFNYL